MLQDQFLLKKINSLRLYNDFSWTYDFHRIFFTFERYLKKKLCNLDKCINMAFKKYNYISYLHAILYNLKR